MKKIFLSGILLFSFLFTSAQDASFKEDVSKLVEITVDTKDMSLMRRALSVRLTTKEKENFNKDYDVIVSEFTGDIEKYYLDKYTHDEIKQLLAFYETPVGKKFLSDKRLLVENDFPDEYPLGMEIYKMKKKEKEKKEE
ncbi:DUF2059 domain-containing protein [Flavobacterium sp.]|uniref:DUF2059 domain-containing protein n=1 Tax=Flavobacterium sp. TaxID=239 RepID=UPI003A91DAB0